MRSIRIAQQLGMPHGTATNRLRKMILFDLLKRHSENTCFKCSQAIECADDLSIEHKQPWEGLSAELFWSLENIAFSHLKCNTPHTRPGVPKPLIHGKGCSGYSKGCKCEPCTKSKLQAVYEWRIKDHGSISSKRN